MIFDSSNLASRAIPYVEKQFELELFKPKQLSLLSKAIAFESMEPVIEAMQQVCSADVQMLTPADFFQLLTWQRFHALKRPAFSEWVCEGLLFARRDNNQLLNNAQIELMVENYNAAKGLPEQAHLENPDDVMLDAKPCKANNKEPLRYSDFALQYLDSTKLDSRLDYPRVKHMVEYDQLAKDAVYSKIAGPARWVRDGNNLAAKIDILFNQPDMELFELACDADVTLRHGILRNVYKPCPVCGIVHEFMVSIEPASFFP